MQQVAASSQEQSASTQQIAAAATALALAAEKLSKLVTSFRLERTTPVIGARASAALRAIREEELEEELERISA
jgi:ribosomal protein L18